MNKYTYLRWFGYAPGTVQGKRLSGVPTYSKHLTVDDCFNNVNSQGVYVGVPEAGGTYLIVPTMKAAGIIRGRDITVRELTNDS